MRDFESICEEIRAERNRQIEKWGDNKPPIDTMLRVIGEEYGEACQAVNDDSIYEYRTELIQVAASCIKAIQAFDAGAHYGPEQDKISALEKECARLRGIIRDAHHQADK